MQKGVGFLLYKILYSNTPMSLDLGHDGVSDRRVLSGPLVDLCDIGTGEFIDHAR